MTNSDEKPKTQNLKLVWKDLDDSEETVIFEMDTDLAGLWRLKDSIRSLIAYLDYKCPEPETDFHGQCAAYQRALITSALKDAKWNKSLAAERLGIQRTTLHEIVKRENITEDVDKTFINAVLGSMVESQIKIELSQFTREQVHRSIRTGETLLRNLKKYK